LTPNREIVESGLEDVGIVQSLLQTNAMEIPQEPSQYASLTLQHMECHSFEVEDEEEKQYIDTHLTERQPGLRNAPRS
jgi:hypothetical protein